MQIAQARNEAAKLIDQRLIKSKAKRPAKDERFMLRYPASGSLIMAADVDTLQEKLAQHIARRSRNLN